MALGAVAEGCYKQMQPMLDQMVALIIPFCQDPVSTHVCMYLCCSRGPRYSVKLKGNVVELRMFVTVTVTDEDPRGRNVSLPFTHLAT